MDEMFIRYTQTRCKICKGWWGKARSCAPLWCWGSKRLSMDGARGCGGIYQAWPTKLAQDKSP